VQLQCANNTIIRAFADGGPVDIDIRIRSPTGAVLSSGIAVGADSVYVEVKTPG
jgi:hypothetical protein